MSSLRYLSREPEFTDEPLPEEIDEPDLLKLKRIVLHFDHRHYGLLTALSGG
jgi:hypothetical protein